MRLCAYGPVSGPKAPYVFRPITSGQLNRTRRTAHFQARPYFVTVPLESGARSPGIAGLSFAQRRQVATMRGVTGMMQARLSCSAARPQGTRPPLYPIRMMYFQELDAWPGFRNSSSHRLLNRWRPKARLRPGIFLS
jgi:hypothetical protein